MTKCSPRFILLFCLISAANVGCVAHDMSGTRLTNSAPVISIEALASNRETIRIYFKNGDYWNTNIRLPDIVLVNTSNRSLTIKEVLVIGTVREKDTVVLTIGGEQLSESIADVNAWLNKLIKQPMSRGRTYGLHSNFGKVSAPSSGFKGNVVLEPGDATAIRLSDLAYLHYVGRDRIDGLSCAIRVEFGGRMQSIPCVLDLTPYSQHGDYIFPLKGHATVASTPWNLAEGHRGSISQEFALDITEFRRLTSGDLSVSSPPDSNNVSDYFAFRKGVHAIGDGVVVSVGNDWPDKWMEDPTKYSLDRVTELTIQLLDDGMDFNHVILGNYAIIDHLNSEFSLYAHMSEGSVTVRAGDAVTQGQMIGRIGNTSNSTDPHLHFQLMDSADFPSANGLPIMFQNVTIPSSPISDLDDANSLLFGDYLFIDTPP